jgi:ubiquinone/menaquinone biosynthesis C-methylase UbiE
MKIPIYRVSFGLIRRLLIIITTGFTDQNFLGAFYIPLALQLQLIPQNLRKKLALNLLSVSPHYFGTKPSNMTRNSFIETEHKRMLLSRECIIKRKVKPYLNEGMTVLDHGCGPGYLANAVALYCDRVIALDISSGVIACAKLINNQPNIQYLTASGTSLSPIKDSSVDIIYSFAVMQHVTDDVCQKILKEFVRVLKPQGQVICEFVVNLPDTENQSIDRGINPVIVLIKEKYVLRVVYRSLEKIKQFVLNAGLEITKITSNQLDPEESNNKEAEPYYTFVFTKP